METVNGDRRGGLQVETDVHVEEVGGPIGEIDQREGVSPQIADIARTRSNCLRTETVSGDGIGALQVEFDMRIPEVGSLVSEIDRWEGDFTLNGGYRPHSLDIAFTWKRLTVTTEVVYKLRRMCMLRR
jgi:hypothetical protein